MNSVIFILLGIGSIAGVDAIICHQCKGWHGSYPNKDEISDCDVRNNQCQGDYFCVKIIDPMSTGVRYTTFRSDCWHQETLAITPGNTTKVEPGTCYDYTDGSTPSKKYKYCFCNDMDYCNTSQQLTNILLLMIISLIYYFY